MSRLKRQRIDRQVESEEAGKQWAAKYKMLELKCADVEKKATRYQEALEEINRLPAGETVAELEKVRFKAVNISFKALTKDGPGQE